MRPRGSDNCKPPEKYFGSKSPFSPYNISNIFGCFDNYDWQALFGWLLSMYFYFLHFEKFTVRILNEYRIQRGSLFRISKQIFFLWWQMQGDCSQVCILKRQPAQFQIYCTGLLNLLNTEVPYKMNLLSFTAGTRDRELLLPSDNSQYL